MKNNVIDANKNFVKESRMSSSFLDVFQPGSGQSAPGNSFRLHSRDLNVCYPYIHETSFKWGWSKVSDGQVTTTQALIANTHTVLSIHHVYRTQSLDFCVLFTRTSFSSKPRKVVICKFRYVL
jgi:hypothetical protein